MATFGTGLDKTFKAGAALKTTTSQYLLVAMCGNTASADYLVELCDSAGNTYAGATAAAFYAIGVNQSYMSSNSEICSVRLFGLSKVKCAASVTAGQFIAAYAGASTTTFAGYVAQVPDGASIGCATASISVHYVIVGRALESGSTNTVIEAYINPYMVDAKTMRE